MNWFFLNRFQFWILEWFLCHDVLDVAIAVKVPFAFGKISELLQIFFFDSSINFLSTGFIEVGCIGRKVLLNPSPVLIPGHDSRLVCVQLLVSFLPLEQLLDLVILNRHLNIIYRSKFTFVFCWIWTARRFLRKSCHAWVWQNGNQCQQYLKSHFFENIIIIDCEINL